MSLSALKYIPAASLTFLFYTYPAWIAVISAVRGTEKLTSWRVVALGLSLAGLALMVGMPGKGGLNPIGAGLALSAARAKFRYAPRSGPVAGVSSVNCWSRACCFRLPAE